MRVAIFNNFANYANRVERKLETYTDYIIAVGAGNSFGPFDKINFKNRDGITTSQVVNLPKGTENFKPNYLLVLKENSDDIVSRWFVTEAYESRAYQYNLSLVRDIIADNWDTVLDTPSVVSRGWARLGSGTNSPIFNSEGFSLSQVKTNEYLLKDKTSSAWIVGYVQNADNLPATITWQRNIAAPSEPDDLGTMLSRGGITMGRELLDVYYRSKYHVDDSTALNRGGTFEFSDSHSKMTAEINAYPDTWTVLTNDGVLRNQFMRNAREYLRTNGWLEYITNYYRNNPPYAFENDFDQYVGKYFTGPGGRKYKLTKKHLTRATVSVPLTDWTIGYMTSAIRYAARQVPNVAEVPDDWDISNDSLVFYADEYQYSRDYIDEISQSVDINTNHRRLDDRPWSMFAMPMNETNVKINSTTFTTLTGIGQKFASVASEQIGDNCLDIQLLPYCPLTSAVSADGIDLGSFTEGIDYSFVTDSNNQKTSVLLWCSESSGTVSIPFSEYSVPNNSLDFKVDQETKLFRLAAPNYSSSWEFSPNRNGEISSFDVDFTYEPLGSYIRLAPHFGCLYGRNFGDSRGLIISCDMSLPKISDNWTNYKLQNANYQKVFDRQVKTQEIGIAVSATGAALDIGLGTAQGVLGLARPLSALGNETSRLSDRYAEVASGIHADDTDSWDRLNSQYSRRMTDINSRRNATMLSGGMAMSNTAIEAINDIGDVAMRVRALSDAKFNHEMNIANIKAQPQTITQIGAFNINNKLFPVLEIYDATESEKENVREFIKYRSMNIGRTATIRDYLSDNERTWIEAALLDTFAYAGDSHELTYLAQELAKGVFIYV